MFTSIELARRIERAEADILRSAAAVVRARRREIPVETMELDGGFAAFVGAGSPLNKCAGLGFAGDRHSGVPTAEDLGIIEAMFFDHGCPAQVEVSSLADPAVLGVLAQCGFRPVGFENVSARPLSVGELTEPDPSISLEECDLGEPREVPKDWLRTVVTGFCHPDTQGIAPAEGFDPAILEPVIADFATAEGMRCYLASVDEAGVPTVAGGGSIRIADGLAQLCGASTLPAFRRRGVQTALLRHRLREAAAAGCDLAVVTTQPGSTSQQNMNRAGFELLYVRAVMVKEPG